MKTLMTRLLLILLFTATALYAAVPQKVSFQAVLKEDGTFLSGDKDVQIGIYTASGVSPVWSQSETDHAFNNGLLSVTLGTSESVPVSALLNENSRIGITVEGDAEPVFVSMTAVPYALVTRYAETVPTASASTLGGIKVGSGLSIDADGVLSSTVSVSTENIQDAIYNNVLSGSQSGIAVTYDDTNNQVSYVVTSQTDENFTTALKTKLDGIATAAEVNQNALTTITADSGSFTASSTTDTLAIEGGGSNVETAISGDTLTITLVGGGGGGLQNLWETFDADSGSSTAGTTTETFTFQGGHNTDTSISGDTLTIDVSTDNIRDAVFKGDGIGVSGGLYYVYNYSERRATISLLQATDSTIGGVKIADSSRIDIDGDGFITVDTSSLDADTVDGEHASAFQDADNTLTALAGVTTDEDKLIYAIGADTFNTTDLTSAARDLLDDGDAATMRATLGLGTAATSASSAFEAADAGLTSIAGLTTEEDRMIYTTASDTYAVTTLTSTARNLLDDGDAATMRSTLGLGTAATSASSAFQSADANLTRLSGQSAPTNGQVLIGNASGGYSVANLTAGSGVTITNGSGSISIAASGGADLTAVDSDILPGTDDSYDLGSSSKTFSAAYINTATLSSMNISSSLKVRNLNADQLDGESADAFQDADATLTALAGVATDANEMIYATGSDTFSATALTSTARNLLDDGDAATMRSTLGLGTAATSASSAFQSADANLTRLSGQSAPTNGQVLIGNASGGYAVANLTAGSGVTITNGSGSISIAASGGADLTAVDSDILPDTDDSYDLGSSSKTFSSAFINTATLSSMNISSSLKVRNLNADQLDGESADAFQDADATLTALAGVATDANEMIYATGSDTFSTTALTSTARNLLDDGDAATMRSTLGLGTAATSASSAFEAADAGLSSIAGLTTAADRMIYTTASDTYAVTTITSTARNLLDDGDAATMRSTLGLGTAATSASSAFEAADAGLSSIAGLTTAADRMIYTTDSDTYAVTTLTSTARNLLDDGDAATMRSTLGLGTAATSASSAFQSADANLTRLSGQSAPTNGQVLIGNASGGYSVANLTAGSGVTITNGSGSISIAASGGADLTAVDSDILPDTDDSYDLGSSSKTFSSAFINTATLSSMNISSSLKVRNLNADQLDGESADAFQDADAGLTSIAGLTTEADRMIYTTASDTYAVTTITSTARNLLDDGDAATMRSTLGLGTAATSASSAFEAADAGLSSIAGLTTAADRMIYTTDSDTYAVTTLTSTARNLLDDGDAATMRSTLGLGTAATSASSAFEAADAGLSSIAGLTTAADRMIYTTDSDTYAVTTLTSTARNLLDDGDAATMRSTLGLGTAATSASSAFQSADATLTALAGIATNSDVMIYATGSDAFTTTTLTSAARTILDDTSVGAIRDTLGLGSSSAPSNGQVLIGNGSDYSTATLTAGSGVTITNGSGSITIAASGGSSGWSLTGNSGTTAGTNFVGTTDTEDLVLKVNDTQVMRYVYNADSNMVIGGYSGNSATSEGAVIAGGGESGAEHRIVSAIYGTISGGRGHTIGASYAAIGGGRNNRTEGQYSFIVGRDNEVTGNYSVAFGRDSIVQDADYAFSGGYKGQVLDAHDNSFVWSDGEISFQSTAAQEFSVAAAGGFRVWSNADSDTVVDTDELLIFDNRRLGVGRTATTYTIEVNGTAAKTAAGEWSSTSDERFKKNIEPLSGALDSVLQLQGVSYYWKKPEEHGNQDFMVRGFIAQEVMKVFPTWVTSDEDGYYYVNTIGMDALLVEALRELNQSLKAENDTLKAQVESLERRIQAIEAKLTP